jgi:hypothetical protein
VVWIFVGFRHLNYKALIALSTAKAIAVLNINQQNNSDRIHER